MTTQQLTTEMTTSTTELSTSTTEMSTSTTELSTSTTELSTSTTELSTSTTELSTLTTELSTTTLPETTTEEIQVTTEFICPAGFTKYGGHEDCYHSRNDALPPIDWYDARDYCIGLGSHLVTIETDAELGIIQSYLNCEFLSTLSVMTCHHS